MSHSLQRTSSALLSRARASGRLQAGAASSQAQHRLSSPPHAQQAQQSSQQGRSHCSVTSAASSPSRQSLHRAPQGSATAEFSRLLGVEADLFGRRRYVSSTTSCRSERSNSNGRAADADQQEQESAEGGEASEHEDASDELAQKLAACEEELKQTKARVVYTLAEIENVRAISKRDVDAARKYAVTGFAKGLLDVADNLSRAIETLPEDKKDKANQDPALSSLLEGVQMTEAQLHKVFGAQGLQRYGSVGDPFDPNLHDALYEIESSADLAPGSVGHVLKPGYTLQGRVIRAAQVGCVKK